MLQYQMWDDSLYKGSGGMGCQGVERGRYVFGSAGKAILHPTTCTVLC